MTTLATLQAKMDALTRQQAERKRRVDQDATQNSEIGYITAEELASQKPTKQPKRQLTREENEKLFDLIYQKQRGKIQKTGDVMFDAGSELGAILDGFVGMYAANQKSKSLDDITQDTAAIDEVRKKLNVSDAMHSLLSTLISDKEQLRSVYEAAAKEAGIPIPMFSDDADKPMIDAMSAGLPRAVAQAVSDNHRLNGDDILKKIGDSFFFGMKLKPK